MASIDEVDVFPQKSSHAACLGAVRGGRRWTSVNATPFAGPIPFAAPLARIMTPHLALAAVLASASTKSPLKSAYLFRFAIACNL